MHSEGAAFGRGDAMSEGVKYPVLDLIVLNCVEGPTVESATYMQAQIELAAAERTAVELEEARKRIAGYAEMEVQSKADGVWLFFRVGGNQCAINMDNYALDRGHVVGGVVKMWCDKVRALDRGQS